MRSREVSANNPSVALRAPAPVVPKAWPPPTKRRWRLGRRSWYPKFFARYRSQNFDHCHSFLLAFSATGGARKRPPFHKGAFSHATPAASRRQSRQAASRTAGASIEAGSWPGTSVLPPQRPLRRRSRFAARRVAGTSNRSRQLTGDSRPPSPGERSRKGYPLPGFRRKPERIRIIFPGDMCGGKNTPRGATCRGRLGGPGAQAECHRHRRNAGAGSWKWLRHFHETPHGAKCGCKAAFGRPCSRTRAQCFAIVSAPFGR